MVASVVAAPVVVVASVVVVPAAAAFAPTAAFNFVVGDAGVADLLAEPAAKDFVSDAHAHAKFVAHTEAASALFDAAGVTPDEGYHLVTSRPKAKAFVEACRALRHWDRGDDELA